MLPARIIPPVTNAQFLKRFLLFMIFMGFMVNTYAIDSLRYSMKHYTDEDGLPQNSIKAIRMGESGYIWLATEDGLTRFDGAHFFVFNSINTKVLSSRFTGISNSLFDDHLYAATIGKDQVMIQDGKAIAVKNFEQSGNNVLATFGLSRTLIEDTATHFIFLPDRSFYCFNKDSLLFYQQGKRSFAVATVPGYEVFKRYFLVGRELYYLTDKGTIIHFENGRPRPAILSGAAVLETKVLGKKFSGKILWNSTGKSTFLYFDNTLYRLTAGSAYVINVSVMLEEFNLAAREIVSALYDEQTETILLGSTTNGLYVFHKKQFQTYSAEAAKNDINPYYAQGAFGNGQILVPSGYVFGNGIASRKITVDRNPNFSRYAMLVDKQGFIWLSDANWLYKLSADYKTIVQKWLLDDEPITLHAGFKNELWIATRKGIIYKLNTDAGAAASPSRLPLKMPPVSWLLQESNDLLWVATIQGLYRLDLNTMKLVTVMPLRNHYITSLYLSQPGQLWITTYNNGFFLLEDGELTHFPLDRNRFLIAAHCMLEDRKGFFWITTNKGLFEVAKADLLAYARKPNARLFYMYYNKENGFNTNEFNGGCQPCGLSLADGHFSFPSLNGMVWFRPDSLRANLPDKQIYIDNAELDDQEISADGELKLSHHFRQLNIWVSTPYLGDRQNVHLYYRLKSDDDAPYLAIAEDGKVSLQNLSSGTYALELIKVNGFGPNNLTRKVITIEVPPYWYQTRTFIALLMLLLFIAVYLLVRIRTRILVKRNRVLEILIGKRTQNLEQALRTLSASQKAQMKQAHIQERLIAAIGHDIKTPLRFLNAANKRIYNELVKLSVASNLLEMSKNAYESSGRMQQYLNNLLAYIKTTLQSGKGADKVAFLLYPLVQSKLDLFQVIAQEQGTVIANELLPSQVILSNPQLMEIILHNLLDNAVKNTRNGRISIHSMNSRDKLIIIIKDTGGGMPAEIREWVNLPNNYYAGMDVQDRVARGPNGIGLFIVKELISLLDASLQIDSKPGIGTTAYVTV